jgi:DNA-binding MarR family transcriptional regulator
MKKKEREITSQQFKFLCNINSNSGKHNFSINSLGRQFFSTDRNVYLVIYDFFDKGLVTIEKGKKELRVNITTKGIKYIQDNYKDYV